MFTSICGSKFDFIHQILSRTNPPEILLCRVFCECGERSGGPSSMSIPKRRHTYPARLNHWFETRRRTRTRPTTFPISSNHDVSIGLSHHPELNGRRWRLAARKLAILDALSRRRPFSSAWTWCSAFNMTPFTLQPVAFRSSCRGTCREDVA